MPTEKATNGRKVNGQFAKGWKGGPGNPLWKHNQELKEALEHCCDTKSRPSSPRKAGRTTFRGRS